MVEQPTTGHRATGQPVPENKDADAPELTLACSARASQEDEAWNQPPDEPQSDRRPPPPDLPFQITSGPRSKYNTKIDAEVSRNLPRRSSMRRRTAGLLSRAALAVGGTGTVAALYLRGSAEEYLVIPESHLPLTYDPAAISAVWRQHPRCALARLGEIGRHMLPFMAGVCAEEVGVRLSAAVRSASASSELGDIVAAARSERQARRAAELRELFTRLGPTFVKCGQMLSIRPDLLPPAAIHELQKLCDAVPSYPTADAMALVAAELGRPVGDVFDDLDESSVPIAAASLGQVYRCRLRGTGELVALKVQRPDMIRAVSLDLYLLRRYMQAVEWFKQEVRGKGVHGRSAGRGRGGCMRWGEGPGGCLEVAWRLDLRRHAAMGKHPWLSRGQRRGTKAFAG